MSLHAVPRRTRGRGPRLAAALAGALAALALAGAPAALAGPCDPPVASPIACENSKPGDPASTWEVPGEGDDTIQGFATRMSIEPGDTLDLKIRSQTSDYVVDILRLGYYGGDGARRVATGLQPTGPHTQPDCLTEASTGLVDCGNWTVSRSWQVPADAVSGVYVARLERGDTGGASLIPFVVRDESSTSDIVVQTSDSTWQAYNVWGGNNLYDCTPTSCPPGSPRGYKAAYKASYNRPWGRAQDQYSSLFGGAEIPMIRFLEANGYDVSYLSSADVGRRGDLIRNHRVFISSGHDEYWSASQRESMEAARDAGVHMAFFSGNEGFWKTRWEPSIDGSGDEDRTLVSYKDTKFTDQQDPVAFTGTWRDPRFTSPAVNTPENALTGQSFLVNSGSAAIIVPAAFGGLRFWRNTPAASLTSGQSLTLGAQTLGFEWDEDADNGYRPAGQVRLSSTTVTGVEVFTDYGTATKFGGTATHNLTLHRAPSGALVFGAGTVQWAYGLDSGNPLGLAPNRTMQQATVNLFADMDVRATTMIAGLVQTNASTDATPPTATLTSAPTSIRDGTVRTLAGTASDTGGGRVAGIEISTDNGSTWHPATGTTSWSYRWIARGHPTTAIRVRATDDSGNTGPATAPFTVSVTCPCSMWGTGVSPAVADSGDTNPVEVGVRFTSERYGTISGLRFFKSAANTGTHTGSLWTAAGTRLAQATFTNETASGWQTVTFATPVPVTPGTTYVASYHAPNGRYAATADAFWRDPAPGPNGGPAVLGPPLRPVQATQSSGNGVFAYGAQSTFPSNSYGGANYWVDVVFNPIPAPGQARNVTATSAGRTSASVTWSAPSTGGAPASYAVVPYDGTTALPPTTVSGTPVPTTTIVPDLTNGRTYTFRVTASNPAGDGPPSNPSNAVTPLNPVRPTAPTGVRATPATRSAQVSWSAPASDGDSPITSYRITPYVAGVAQPVTFAGPADRRATVSGLANGTAYTFRVAAVNAVGTGTNSTASAAVTPRFALLDFAAPDPDDSGDSAAVELGVTFRPHYDGAVTGVRFYKAAGNTGTHVGSLWSAGGTRLAQATFTNESASGWQSVTFATPVQVTADTTYVASYHAPTGRYSATPFGLASALVNGPITAPGGDTTPNGVYAYGAQSTFPSSSYRSTNYWVDVLYAPAGPGTPEAVTATAGPSAAEVSWAAPTTGGAPSSYTVTPYIGSVAQAPLTVSGTPPATRVQVSGLQAGTTYTFRVTAQNPGGSGPASAPSNEVTPLAAAAPGAPDDVAATPATDSAQVTWRAPTADGGSPITGYRITPYDGESPGPATVVGENARTATITGLTNGTAYTLRVAALSAVGTGAETASAAVTPRSTIFDLTEPANADAGDGSSIALGVKFSSDVPGAVTGVRFFKSAANTGAHVGSLWAADGTLLAEAPFTAETASGWQAVVFADPVPIVPGATYVASYHAPDGHYAATGGAFATEDTVRAPLRALSTLSSPNGLFAYGATPAFPTGNWNATNYWVDVLFAPSG